MSRAWARADHDPAGVRNAGRRHQVLRRCRVLLAEQSASLALDVADIVHVLSLGEIAMSGRAADLTRDDVTNAYLGIRAR